MKEHKHTWEVSKCGEFATFVECPECKLQVELYGEHLSVYRYSDRKTLKFSIPLNYPVDVIQ